MLKLRLLIILLLSTFFTISAIADENNPTQEEVAKLYVATFNRAPDIDGLIYWMSDSGLTLSEIAQSFFDQPETQELYPKGVSNSDFIKAVYNNLFNRDPEIDGLNYWINELDSNRFSKNRFIEAVINGAFGLDKTILDNKTQIGLYFANAGLSNTSHANNLMKCVSSSEYSVEYAKDKIDNLNLDYDYTCKILNGVSLIANAGPDISVLKGKAVKLDASKSIDYDNNTIVSYIWKEGNKFLGNGITKSISELSIGKHEITLIVKNSQGVSDEDKIIIEILEDNNDIYQVFHELEFKFVNTTSIFNGSNPIDGYSYINFIVDGFNISVDISSATSYYEVADLILNELFSMGYYDISYYMMDFSVYTSTDLVFSGYTIAAGSYVGDAKSISLYSTSHYLDGGSFTLEPIAYDTNLDYSVNYISYIF